MGETAVMYNATRAQPEDVDGNAFSAVACHNTRTAHHLTYILNISRFCFLSSLKANNYGALQ
jgi:hypothetical protein